MTVVVVVLTVVINGVTMPPLMSLLKMTQLSESRKMMVEAGPHTQCTTHTVPPPLGALLIFCAPCVWRRSTAHTRSCARRRAST